MVAKGAALVLWTKAEDEILREFGPQASVTRQIKRAAWNRRRVRMLGSQTDPVTVKETRRLFAQYPICVYCRVCPSEVLDHVIPLARGGSHTIDNLLPACEKCNFSKGSKTLEEWFSPARKERS